MSSVVIELATRARRNPGAPLVTYVDQARGERTELSAASLANAAAKIANALRDEYDLEPGSLIALLVPMHWQLSAWLAGAWTAGMIVTLEDDDDADLVVTTAARAASMPREVTVLSLHPFGLPLSEPLPPNAHDATLAVRQQPDAYLFDTPPPTEPALRNGSATLPGVEIWRRATELAREWGLQPAGRLLVTADATGVDAILSALAVPLSAEAAVVIANQPTDVEHLRSSEGVTASAEPPR
jgi:uncharacterized protein (TIGR03089 family)